ncbi:MAG: cytochrome-c peroxidase [Deltaproteobacteria bacterium]|nr:MAG: cytochrome-c peroxidase [Deltaproteobacteria bacterium]
MLCGLVAGSACGDKGGPEAKPAPAKHGASAKEKEQAAAKKKEAIPDVSAAQILERAKPLFSPLPEVMASPDNPVTDAKVELGRMLYYDTRLSKNHDISCNTCHDLEKYGVDPRGTPTSAGHKGQMGDRNSPTVYNAALQIAQFWDGREPTVEAQAKQPILNPVEMAMPNEAAVVAVLESIPGYVEKFKAAFPDDAKPVTYDNMAKAIGAFERKLVTPAPFDQFLAGNMGALNKKQLWGLQLFMDVGCTTCHTGPGLGGTMFQKLGSVKPWPTKDEGRYKVTKQEADKFVFKVPILRNITKTGPYLHDGSIADLGEMVQKMAEHQTAKGRLSDAELDALLAFLDALTGEIPKELIAKPELPASGPNTPKPDPS